MKDTEIVENYHYTRKLVKDLQKTMLLCCEEVDYLQEQVKEIERQIEVINMMLDIPEDKVTAEKMRQKILEIEDINLNG